MPSISMFVGSLDKQQTKQCLIECLEFLSVMDVIDILKDYYDSDDRQDIADEVAPQEE